MVVKCDSKMCKNYKNGICQAETIEIKNFEYCVQEEKEYNDIERCRSYEKDDNWLSK